MQVDAERREIFGDVADVLVLGAPGQDFVADHEQRGGDGVIGGRRIGDAHGDLTARNRPDRGQPLPCHCGSCSIKLVCPAYAIIKKARKAPAVDLGLAKRRLKEMQSW